MTDQTTSLSPNPRPHAEEAALAAVSKHGPHTGSLPTLRNAPIGAPQGEVQVLSARHERFVLEFLKDGNATRAYVRAGYSPRGAQPSASRLLRQPRIEAAIAAGRQRVTQALALSVERIGREYAQIAFASVDDFVSIEEDGRLRVDLEKASKAQRAGIVELKVSNHSKPEQMVTLKLGKLQALAALTKHVGLFTKRPEPALPSADRERYERAIAKLGEELWQATERLNQVEDERDEAQTTLTAIKMQRIADDLEASRELGDDPDIPDPDAEEAEGQPLQSGVIASGLNDPQPHAEEAALAAVAEREPQAPSVSPTPGDVPLCGARRDEVAAESKHPTAAPEEPRPPIVLKGLGPPDPPRPKRAPPPPSQPTQPQPHVAGSGNGTIFWNTARQPPSGPTWHDILRQGGRFPGR